MLDDDLALGTQARRYRQQQDCQREGANHGIPMG
jgi:hypothetical protein